MQVVKTADGNRHSNSLCRCVIWSRLVLVPFLKHTAGQCGEFFAMR